MQNPKYTISVKAQSDIKAIAQYTIKEFGKNQSLRYAQGLKDILEK